VLDQSEKMGELKFLVIEDNPSDVALLRYALNCHGEEYDLEVLRDGQQALQFVSEHRSGKRKPDLCLIVLDLHLPKYDGLEILRAIREAPALTHIRVVIVSGLASPKEKLQLAELAAELRTKPSSLQDTIEFAGELIALCKSVHVVGA
jgi:CheY-like chemotaxis protein